MEARSRDKMGNWIMGGIHIPIHQQKMAQIPLTDLSPLQLD